MTLAQRIEKAAQEMREKREAMEARQAERNARLDRKIAEFKKSLAALAAS